MRTREHGVEGGNGYVVTEYIWGDAHVEISVWTFEELCYISKF